MQSLSDRLKSLGVKVGAQDITPLPTPERQNLEQVLGGHALDTPLGETFVVESRYPAGSLQGQASLALEAPLDVLAAWAGEDRLRRLSPQALAFLDTETTGITGGTGTYTFLIGVGRFEGDDFLLAQFFMRDPLEEPAQLAALEAFLAPCEALVTFNGKAFDAPLLTTRYLTHGWRSPLPEMAHIDLLHLARRLWRERLPSRTLGNLEAQILGATRTEDDIPGWMIPQMYFDYLRDLDARPLKSVFYHNAMDVVSLAALLNHMAGLLADPIQSGSRFSLDLIALAKLFEDLGDLDIATRLYLHGLHHEDVEDERLPMVVLLDALQRLALIYKRNENWPAAIELWEQAARSQHLHSHIELAKYYEHHQRDYTAAIVWTQSAIQLVDSSETTILSLYERRQWLDELQHRLARLQQKLSRLQ